MLEAPSFEGPFVFCNSKTRGIIGVEESQEEIYSADSTLRKKAYSRNFLYNVDALYGSSFYGLTRRVSSSKWCSFLIENL